LKRLNALFTVDTIETNNRRNYKLSKLKRSLVKIADEYHSYRRLFCYQGLMRVSFVDKNSIAKRSALNTWATKLAKACTY